MIQAARKVRKTPGDAVCGAFERRLTAVLAASAGVRLRKGGAKAESAAIASRGAQEMVYKFTRLTANGEITVEEIVGSPEAATLEGLLKAEAAAQDGKGGSCSLVGDDGQVLFNKQSVDAFLPKD
jgi:hypothetical protein